MAIVLCAHGSPWGVWARATSDAKRETSPVFCKNGFSLELNGKMIFNGMGGKQSGKNSYSLVKPGSVAEQIIANGTVLPSHTGSSLLTVPRSSFGLKGTKKHNNINYSLLFAISGDMSASRFIKEIAAEVETSDFALIVGNTKGVEDRLVEGGEGVEEAKLIHTEVYRG